MNHYEYSCEKYRNQLIKLIKPKLNGLRVLNNNDLLLNIFSYFKSGWYVKDSGYRFHTKICIYKDIFSKHVNVHQVTDRIQNPYRDKGVCKKAGNCSIYVGPVISWYKTIHNTRRFKYK